ncbi:MAG TPA: alpha/beta hydrolase, partial [Pedobacter sp.]|nr:alpha/beta hydrolase [Pedobacter sp.]
LDLTSRQLGALVPVGKNIFRDNNDSTKTFSFVLKDKKVEGLQIKNGTKLLLGKKVNHHIRKEVSFKNDTTVLKGDLYLPIAKGSHPVVVFAHGSGATTRGVGFFTTYFLQLGIGVLTFDKRGAGASAGDWETASFETLANDICAGIDFLKTQVGVNPKKIGLLGNSQGGWVGSIAAAKTKSLAFLLMRVGAGESVLETISHEYRGSLLADGFSNSEVDEIIPMYQKHWLAAASGKTWDEGNEILKSYANNSWYKKVFPQERLKSSGSEKWWTWLKANLKYDSYSYLRNIKTPTLWLMAEKDWNVNSQKSYPRIKEALAFAGNQDYTVAIVPNMGHTGMTVATGYYNEALSWQYADGFWNRVESWLINRKIAKKN